MANEQNLSEGNSSTAAPVADDALNLLVLDDSEFDRLRIKRMLSDLDQNIVAQSASTLSEFKSALSREEYDFILLDYRLPDGDGLDALEAMKTGETATDAIPIMIAGEEDVRVAVSAVKGGCASFIPKAHLSAEALQNAISSALRESLVGHGPDFDHQVEVATHKVIRSINDSYFATIRPNLAGMLRKLRALRTASVRQQDELTRELEDNCLEIWHALHEFDNYRNALKTKMN
ncbi:MAG: response regulator [Pseudomonadota bacterium]